MSDRRFGGWFQWGREQPEDPPTPTEGLPPEYDVRTALLLALASTWAYSDAASLADILDRSVLPEAQVELLEVRNPARLLDTQVFLVRDPGAHATLVVFRGTEIGGANITDILTDLFVDPVNFPRGSSARVHRGFLDGLIAVWPRLLDALSERPDDRIYLAGHSLGGAQAALMAVALGLDQPGIMQADDLAVHASIRDRIDGVHTFGQPMIGDPEFAARAEQVRQTHGLPIVRHVFDEDIVPRLPGKDVGDFAHFGVELRGDDNSLGWTCPGQGAAVRQVKRSVLGLLVGALDFAGEQLAPVRSRELPLSVGDHLPQRYVDLCKRAVFGREDIPYYP
ncbi:MAG: lipase family protein [Myxococcota bacterium]